MFVPGRDISWRKFLDELVREWFDDDVPMIAGALAYSGILALFPFLVFVVALAGLVITPEQAAPLVEQLHRVAPPPVAEILGERVRAIASDQSPGLLTASAVATVWAASSGLRSLITALNTALDVQERRPFWKLRIVAIVTTLSVATLVIAAVALAVAAPAVAGQVGGALGALLLWARLPLAALLMMIVIATLYHALPDVPKRRFRFLSTGAVVAVAVWIAASAGFSYYVSNFGDYDVTYGALGGFIVLLLWMWISSIAVVLGAEINAIGARAAAGAKGPGRSGAGASS